MKLAEQAIRAGYRINSFETLGSTNDEAMARAHQGDRGKLWVVAARQTGGRGRQGRAWASPPGNVYASLLLVDPVAQAVAPQLSFVAGVALADTIAKVAPSAAGITLKWPNDIVHGGAKLAGILVEGLRFPNGRFACVLGFGVNRLSHPVDLPYAAVDLFSVAGDRPSVDSFVSTLSASVDDALELWDRGKRFEAIRTTWLDRAHPRGAAMTVAAGTRRVSGRFETIDGQGRLILKTDDGPVTVDAGDVFLMKQPAESAG